MGWSAATAEGKVTTIYGLLAVAVLLGLVFNASLGWWWADPLSAYVLVYYAVKEARDIFPHNLVS
jgi:divalent metal cation (Fe/Co/Zn/Cd) transporter